MTETASIVQHGSGQAGYCKICAASFEQEINERLKLGREAGWSDAKIVQWVKDRRFVDDRTGRVVTLNRQTVAKHRRHLQAPEDKFVALVEQKRRQGAVIPRQTSTDQFLQTVVDVGMGRAMEHPEDITVDQALKAAGILARKTDKVTPLAIVLAEVVTEGRHVIDVTPKGDQ